jgi:hypothetical protein
MCALKANTQSVTKVRMRDYNPHPIAILQYSFQRTPSLQSRLTSRTNRSFVAPKSSIIVKASTMASRSVYTAICAGSVKVRWKQKVGWRYLVMVVHTSPAVVKPIVKATPGLDWRGFGCLWLVRWSGSRGNVHTHRPRRATPPTHPPTTPNLLLHFRGSVALPLPHRGFRKSSVTNSTQKPLERLSPQ